MEINKRGNRIKRTWLSTERYRWDFNEPFRSDGWEQYDTSQDAWYFGVWVNPRKLVTLSYAEGDWTLVVCPDAEHYNAEIADANEFYGEGRIALVIDQAGGATEYRQDRERFLIPA